MPKKGIRSRDRGRREGGGRGSSDGRCL